MLELLITRPIVILLPYRNVRAALLISKLDLTGYKEISFGIPVFNDRR